MAKKRKWATKREWYGSVQHFNSEAPYIDYLKEVEKSIKARKKIPRLVKL